MAKNVYVKNITSSGIQIPDLSGIYIDAYSQRDLREYFSLDDIDYSLDLKTAISGGLLVLNDGTKDLTMEESFDISSVPTFYELPDHLIKMEDTPDDYEDGSYLKSTVSGTEWATLSGTPGIVSIIKYDSSEGESSTTNTIYTQKLRLTSGVIPPGDYIIKWYYEWQYKHGSFQFKARVQMDDTTDLMEHIEQPDNISSWSPVSGFKRETLIAGNHYIDLDYCGSKTGAESKIRRARLELWGV